MINLGHSCRRSIAQNPYLPFAVSIYENNIIYEFKGKLRQKMGHSPVERWIIGRIKNSVQSRIVDYDQPTTPNKRACWFPIVPIESESYVAPAMAVHIYTHSAKVNFITIPYRTHHTRHSQRNGYQITMGPRKSNPVECCESHLIRLLCAIAPLSPSNCFISKWMLCGWSVYLGVVDNMAYKRLYAWYGHWPTCLDHVGIYVKINP